MQSIKIGCHCEKMQARLLSLSKQQASIFEAILQSVTAETLIHINLDTLQ